MNRTLPLLPALALGVLLGLPASGQATCYRVTSVGSETTTSNTQIRPGEGTAGSWTGACDTCNGSLGLPSVVNVSDESFQPYPTLIASAVAPLTQYGATGGYDPERVFFRCSAGDAVYEMFSTNGDDLYSGYYTGADTVGNDIGLQDAYRTAWPNVLLRLTNVETGETITPIWKERQLSGLDIDSRGFQLVKAKNLAAVRAELYSAPLEAIRYYSPTILSQPYSYTQPAAHRHQGAGPDRADRRPGARGRQLGRLVQQLAGCHRAVPLRDPETLSHLRGDDGHPARAVPAHHPGRDR